MNVALIAHDNKKTLMENLCIAYKGILKNHNLHATGTTGRLIESVTGLSVHKYLAGHLGGEQQIGAQIANNTLDVVILLQDSSKQHGSDLSSIIRLCDMHNIPVATNLSTAEILLFALDRGDLDWRNNMR